MLKLSAFHYPDLIKTSLLCGGLVPISHQSLNTGFFYSNGLPCLSLCMAFEFSHSKLGA